MVDNRGRSGFTILEILIALVVLSVGLLGILAVFPANIRKTTEIVEKTYGANIAESVRSAVELGMQKARVDDGSEVGFIYLGEGVKTLVVDKAGNTLPIDVTDLDGDPPAIDKTADYWVLLPKDNGKKYVFPNPNPSAPADFKQNSGVYMSDVPRTTQGNPAITKVFPMGADIAKIADPTNGSYTIPEHKEADKVPLPKYSYAFTLEEIMIDTDSDGTPDKYPDDHSIYRLTIYVYRDFPNVDAANPESSYANKHHQPIKDMTFVTLVSF